MNIPDSDIIYIIKEDSEGRVVCVKKPGRLVHTFLGPIWFPEKSASPLPHRRVTGTADPSAPMPYNPADLKGLDIDSMIDISMKHINEEFEKQNGVPVAVTLDDEAREDIKKSLEEIMKGKPWQVLDEYGTGGKKTRGEVHGAYVPVVDVLHATIRELKEQREDAHAKIKYLAKESEKLQEQNASMESDLETQNNEVLRLRREVAALNGNLLAARTVNARYEGVLRQILSDLTAMDDTLRPDEINSTRISRIQYAISEALKGSAKKAPTTNAWSSIENRVYEGHTFLFHADDAHQATLACRRHNAEMERVSKR